MAFERGPYGSRGTSTVSDASADSLWSPFMGRARADESRLSQAPSQAKSDSAASGVRKDKRSAVRRAACAYCTHNHTKCDRPFGAEKCG